MKLPAATLAVCLLLGEPNGARAQTSQPLRRVVQKHLKLHWTSLAVECQS
jgi:hypothetical protein